MMETDRMAPLRAAVWGRKSILINHSSTGTAGIQRRTGGEGAAQMRPIPAQGRIPTGEEFRTRADAALMRVGAPRRGRKELCGFRE